MTCSHPHRHLHHDVEPSPSSFTRPTGPTYSRRGMTRPQGPLSLSFFSFFFSFSLSCTPGPSLAVADPESFYWVGIQYRNSAPQYATVLTIVLRYLGHRESRVVLGLPETWLGPPLFPWSIKGKAGHPNGQGGRRLSSALGHWKALQLHLTLTRDLGSHPSLTRL
jgi:hypothetical protein